MCNLLAFRTSVLLCLLLDLDTYGGVNPLVAFHLFLQKVVDIIAPKRCINFCRLVGFGLFPECWQSANVTAIPKGAPFHDRENYQPISITTILSKLYEKLVSHKLSSFSKKYGF